jgi:hypothetical protein
VKKVVVPSTQLGYYPTELLYLLRQAGYVKFESEGGDGGLHIR